ncbi:MAG: DUF2281 domain-containing protein [Planctomycetes bacterium]|nr:DUF2281 domain-containing protein [Planctomycetota bacterium]
MQTSLWAVVHSGKIELTEPVDLPEGVRVLVTLMPKNATLAEIPRGRTRVLGTLRGTVEYLSPDFDAPLDDFREYMA